MTERTRQARAKRSFATMKHIRRPNRKRGMSVDEKIEALLVFLKKKYLIWWYRSLPTKRKPGLLSELLQEYRERRAA